MIYWSRRKLLKAIDVKQVRQAIEEAETQTSGEIRVSLSGHFTGNLRRTAERAFARLGIHRTRERNGILFFIVPSRRRFVILGDVGIHANVGQPFWDHLAESMAEKFHDGAFTEGLIQGIREAGARLAEHFPCEPSTDINELSDEIDVGDCRDHAKGEDEEEEKDEGS